MYQTIENVVSETMSPVPSSESGNINNVSTANQASQTDKVLEEEHMAKKNGRKKLVKSPAQPKVIKGKVGRKPKINDTTAPKVDTKSSISKKSDPKAASKKGAKNKKSRNFNIPKFAKHIFNIQPAMTDSEKQALKHSIELNGFDPLKPIIIFQEKILDGFHRYNACLDLNIKPKFFFFKGTEMEAVRLVLSSETRRHMTKSQGAAVAVESTELITHIKEQIEKERRLKQRETNKKKAEAKANGIELSEENPPDNNDTHKSGNLIAELFNTSRDYLPKAERILAADPDLHTKVKAGVKSIQAAIKVLDGKMTTAIENSEEIKPFTNKCYPVIYIKLSCNKENHDEIDPKMLNKMLTLKISTIACQDNATVFVQVPRDCKSHAKKVMSGWGFKLSESIVVIHEHSSYQTRYCKIMHDELLVFERNGGAPLAITEANAGSWIKEDKVFETIDALYPRLLKKPLRILTLLNCPTHQDMK